MVMVWLIAEDLQPPEFHMRMPFEEICKLPHRVELGRCRHWTVGQEPLLQEAVTHNAAPNQMNSHTLHATISLAHPAVRFVCSGGCLNFVGRGGHKSLISSFVPSSRIGGNAVARRSDPESDRRRIAIGPSHVSCSLGRRT